MPDSIAGIILAGGLSSRMGGGDKPLLELNGKPVLHHIIGRISPQVGALALNANGDLDRFAAFGLPVLPDTTPGFPGPLAGVLAGLEWIEAQQTHQALVTVAGDTPFLPFDLVARLSAARSNNPQAIAIAGSGGRDHPVFGLWPAGMSAPLRSYLIGGGRKVLDFIRSRPFVSVNFDAHDGIDPFFNINTPDDLAEARRLITESHE
ncbi:molybdenum cofactor guanylyltransferase MobA [Aquamicrobium ahrensii]|uniref:Molybdenum cofactor guanylyltransferase n=1 Tax=Aquamicrobium ahrensii TaxID=469551 RepID=A0ABV2KG14_9HYPH